MALHSPVIDGSPATNMFLDVMSRLPAGSGALAFDVGANDGTFSASLARHCAKFMPRVALKLHIFEPQPAFAERLANLAFMHNASFHQAIATHEDRENVTLFVSRQNSQTASTLSSNSDRYRMPQRRQDRSSRREERPSRSALPARRPKPRPAVTVRSVNLARVLLQEQARLQARHDAVNRPVPLELPGGAALARQQRVPILLKLDVEGGEFALLPHLLTTGALCAVTHLRVEYHLNSIPEGERLDGVALRLGLRHLLRKGCRRGRVPSEGEGGDADGNRDVVVEAEEWRPLNFGEAVPGLAAEAARHMTSAELRGELRHGDLPLGIAWNLTVHKWRAQARTLFTTRSDDDGAVAEAYKGLG